jgi:hypothetical protein
MISRSKLRGPIGRIGPYAVAVFLSLAMIEAIITGNPPYSSFAFGCFFIVFGIVEYQRTKLMTYLILGLGNRDMAQHGSLPCFHFFI